MHLSPFLFGISELIGLPKTLILVEHYGGIELYIPMTLGADHKIARMIGLEAAQKLAQKYPGTTVTVALNATGDHAQHHAKRRERIRELRAQGKSHSQIARELRTTDRTVRAVLGAEIDDRQQTIF